MNKLIKTINKYSKSDSNKATERNKVGKDRMWWGVVILNTVSDVRVMI